MSLNGADIKWLQNPANMLENPDQGFELVPAYYGALNQSSTAVTPTGNDAVK